MNKYLISKIIFISLLFAGVSEGSDLLLITQNIKAICRQSTSNHGSQSKFQFLKRNVKFTKEEWEGIQQVLKEDQLYDNKDYRNCVENIAKLFVTRYRPQESDQLTGTKKELEEMSQCRKNKKHRDKIRPRN